MQSTERLTDVEFLSSCLLIWSLLLKNRRCPSSHFREDPPGEFQGSSRGKLIQRLRFMTMWKNKLREEKLKGGGKRRGGKEEENVEKFRRKKMRVSSYFTDEETEAQRPKVTWPAKQLLGGTRHSGKSNMKMQLVSEVASTGERQQEAATHQSSPDAKPDVGLTSLQNCENQMPAA